MYTVPKIDILEKYSDEFRYSHTLNGSARGKDMLSLIEMIEKEDNPCDFREELMSVSQVYFDALCENQTSDDAYKRLENWEAEKEILDAVINCGKESMASFYNGEGIDMENIREMLIPYASLMIEKSHDVESKGRHLMPYAKKVHSFGRDIQEKFGKDVVLPERLVCVASGGFEPSYLLMNIADIDSLLPLRFSPTSREDTEVKLPSNAPSDYIGSHVNSKGVMVVEDWILTGQSMDGVMNEVIKNNPSDLTGTFAICHVKNKDMLNLFRYGNKMPTLFVR